MTAHSLQICYASTNPGKLRETRLISDQLETGWKLVARPQALTVPDETGRSFLSNAYLKAACTFSECMEAIGDWAEEGTLADGVLAEDSGLCIDALAGAPGIFSARFGGIPSGQSQCQYLLDLLEEEGVEKARAFYISATVLIVRSSGTQNINIYCGVGTTHGYILPCLTGNGGFGYDPIFYSDDLRCSMAEAAPEEKSRISHRYRGLTALYRNMIAGRCL